MNKDKLRTISYGIVAILLLGAGLYEYKYDSIRKEINEHGEVGEGILTNKPSNCRMKKRWATLLYKNKSYDFIISYKDCEEMELGETLAIKYYTKYPNKIYTAERLKTVNGMIKWDMIIMISSLPFCILFLVRVLKRRK